MTNNITKAERDKIQADAQAIIGREGVRALDALPKAEFAAREQMIDGWSRELREWYPNISAERLDGAIAKAIRILRGRNVNDPHGA